VTPGVSHPVVSNERCIDERKKLLAREKELTRLRDQIARERRALPWEHVSVFFKDEAGDVFHSGVLLPSEPLRGAGRIRSRPVHGG
jgi:hypothetical protein